MKRREFTIITKHLDKGLVLACNDTEEASLKSAYECVAEKAKEVIQRVLTIGAKDEIKVTITIENI